MRLARFGSIVFCGSLAAALAQEKPGPAADSRKDRMSTALGVNMAEYWKSRGLEAGDINIETMAKAFAATLAREKAPITPAEQEQGLALLRSDLRTRSQERRRQMLADNQRASLEFLSRNASQPGVQLLPDGLQYRVIHESAGLHPTTNDFVVVNYRGRLPDGKEFAKNTSSAPVRLDAIQGCAGALQHMSPGTKWQVIVPPALGYGERGLGQIVPPNSVLIYELELVSIQSGPPIPPQIPAGKSKANP